MKYFLEVIGLPLILFLFLAVLTVIYKVLTS